jgi:CheY-like chemotaxis protein
MGKGIHLFIVPQDIKKEFALSSGKIAHLMSTHILMIENDEDDRLLTRENFQTDWPAAAIEFISSVELTQRLTVASPRPQLILLSMNARPYNGVDLIRRIRRERGFESSPIVILSESALPEEVNACYSAGASTFIKKPAAYSDTLSKIKSFIAYWSQTAELPMP